MAAAQLHELRQVASGLNDAPFVCGGIVDPAPRGAEAKSVSMYYHDSRGELVELPFPPPELFALERLVEACEPATFGRGKEDVLDPAYRRAVRLDAGQFATSFNVAEFPILAEVQNLIGDSVNCVRAITHKLNVYTTGGFFKPHQDTPRNANTIGTLVVCLPTQFEGGEFVVKSADGSFAHTFDWGAADAAANGKVQWCAFYSDCEHEVLQVRAGHRVTLTYVLEHQPVENPMLVGAQPFTTFSDHLEALLKDPSFAPQGTKLGFGLKHQYIVSKPSESREHDHALVLPLGASMPFVKGADRMLMDTLDRLGLQYVFAPVYARSGYGRSAADLAARRYYREEDEDRPTTYGVHFGKRVAPPTEWRFPFRTEGDPEDEWRGDGERFLFISSWDNYVDYEAFGTEDCSFGLDVYTLGLYRARDVVWIVGPTNFPYLKTGISYGNEHTLRRYYAAACLLVYIPPFHKRGNEVSRG